MTEKYHRLPIKFHHIKLLQNNTYFAFLDHRLIALSSKVVLFLNVVVFCIIGYYFLTFTGRPKLVLSILLTISICNLLFEILLIRSEREQR